MPSTSAPASTVSVPRSATADLVDANPSQEDHRPGGALDHQGQISRGHEGDREDEAQNGRCDPDPSRYSHGPIVRTYRSTYKVTWSSLLSQQWLDSPLPRSRDHDSLSDDLDLHLCSTTPAAASAATSAAQPRQRETTSLVAQARRADLSWVSKEPVSLALSMDFAICPS